MKGCRLQHESCVETCKVIWKKFAVSEMCQVVNRYDQPAPIKIRNVIVRAMEQIAAASKTSDFPLLLQTVNWRCRADELKFLSGKPGHFLWVAAKHPKPELVIY